MVVAWQCDAVRPGEPEPCDSKKDSSWLCLHFPLSSSGLESSIMLIT